MSERAVGKNVFPDTSDDRPKYKLLGVPIRRIKPACPSTLPATEASLAGLLSCQACLRPYHQPRQPYDHSCARSTLDVYKRVI